MKTDIPYLAGIVSLLHSSGIKSSRREHQYRNEERKLHLAHNSDGSLTGRAEGFRGSPAACSLETWIMG